MKERSGGPKSVRRSGSPGSACRSIAWIVGVLAACGRADATTTPEPSHDRAGSPTARAATSAPLCGRGGERFADHDWLPGDARLVVAISADSVELAPALAALEAWARTENTALPIHAGFALSQLSWEAPMILETFARAGFRPHELVRLTAPDGATAWVAPTSCSLDDIAHGVRDAWGVPLRAGVGAWIGTPDDPKRFAFAVSILPGDRLVLSAAEPTDSVRRWLVQRPRADPAGTSTDPTAGAILQATGPAPVIAVLGGRALLRSDAAAQPLRAVRVTEAGVETIDPSAVDGGGGSLNGAHE